MSNNYAADARQRAKAALTRMLEAKDAQDWIRIRSLLLLAANAAADEAKNKEQR